MTVLARTDVGPIAALRERLTRRSSARMLALEAETLSSRLGWSAPARTITVAGVHGGAGASTLCLLLAQAIARFGADPALTVDLAGRGRGGLAALGGAAGPTTEGASAARGRHLFGVGPAGVRIIGAAPDDVEAFDRSHETLAARLAAAVDEGREDEELGAFARLLLAEHGAWRALRWDNGHATERIGALLDEVVEGHALVAVDLGMLDSPPLAHSLAERSALHVWVTPCDPASLRIAHQRLPTAPFEPRTREAIVAWSRDGVRPPSSKRLSDLGDLRGCPVVRLGDHGADEDWPSRLARCLAGVSELCELAR